MWTEYKTGEMSNRKALEDARKVRLEAMEEEVRAPRWIRPMLRLCRRLMNWVERAALENLRDGKK
jgi:hypothetical protein